VNFSIAVQAKKDEAYFFNVTAWDKTAEVVHNTALRDRQLCFWTASPAKMEDKEGKPVKQ